MPEGLESGYYEVFTFIINVFNIEYIVKSYNIFDDTFSSIYIMSYLYETLLVTVIKLLLNVFT